jgi:Gpi18-like mannosyltransferase
MALIFTFGHYMHERYVVPILVMLLFAYAYYKDKRLLLAALLFTVTTFLNEMMAQYVVSQGAMNVIRGGREHNTVLRFWSGAEVIVCLYFVYVVLDMIHDLKGKLTGILRREEDDRPSRLYTFIEEGLQK